MGYLNPLLALPAVRRLMTLPPRERAALAAVLTDLRVQANGLAEASWRRKKGPMAAYYRAVSTYARHLAHVLRRGAAEPSDAAAASVQALLHDLEKARAHVDLLVSAARAALPREQHPPVDDATLWARQLRGATVQQQTCATTPCP
jgi:hypothetical protein